MNRQKTINLNEAANSNINNWIADLYNPQSIGILNITNRFTDNSKGFWQSHRFYIYIFLIALTADTFSTVHFMSYLGVNAEFHPAVRYISVLFGPVAGPFLGGLLKCMGCFVVTIYFRKYANLIFISAALIYLWAAWYNIWGIVGAQIGIPPKILALK